MNSQVDLKISHAFCRRLTRKQAKNFYFAFWTLPVAKRELLYAFYAWLRIMDDLADDSKDTIEATRALQVFETQSKRALGLDTSAIGASESPYLGRIDPKIWPAFAHFVGTSRVNWTELEGILEGCRMDQHKLRYENFEELREYCYRVASLVGLVCLKIFGTQSKEAVKAGEHLGLAFQLTNILRDVREDADRGRIYLPQDELKTFQIQEDELKKNQLSPAVFRYFKFFAERAEQSFRAASQLPNLVDSDSRSTLIAMTGLYHSLLKKMISHDFSVLSQRVSLSLPQKLWVVLGSRVS